MGYDGQVVINTKINDKGLKNGLLSIEGLTQKSLSRLKSMIGTAAISALVAKGVSEIVSSTSALETSMAKASTLFGSVEVDTAALEARTLSLSSASGILASEIGQSLYNALSAGVEVTEDMSASMSFMEKNARLAKAGFSDIDTTVTATAKVLNAYKLGVEETDRIHKVLMQTQNKGITTVGELGGVLAQVTPTAAAFGVQFEEIGTQLAILTKNGTPAAQAVTQINQMLSELGKSGTIASENLGNASEAAGKGRKSFQELVDEGMSVGDILDMMRSYAEANKLSMVDMFSSIDAGKGALAIASAGIEEYNSLMGDMATESDVVTEAYTKVMGTFAEQSKRLGTAVQNAGTIMGSKLLPRITPIVSGLADTINRMSGATSASDTLRPALDNLTTALEEYKRAQDEAASSTGDMSTAMLEQSAIAVKRALQIAQDAYRDSNKELSTYQKGLANTEAFIPPVISQLDAMAQSLGTTRQGLADMAAAGKLDRGQLQYYQNLADQLDLLNSEQVRYASSVKKAEKDRDAFIKGLAEAYVRGVDGIGLFIDANEGLRSAVMDQVDALNARKRAQEDFDKITIKSVAEARNLANMYRLQSNANKDSVYWAEMYALAQAKVSEFNAEAVKTGEDAADTTRVTTDIMKAYDAAVAKAGATFKVTGDDQRYLSDRISATEGAMIALLMNGVLPTDAAYVNLSRTLGDLRSQVEGEEESVYDANKAYEEAVKALAAVDTAHGILGDSVDVSAEKQGVLMQAIREMVANGIDPANEKLRELIALFAQLNGVAEQSALEKWYKDLAESSRDWGKFAASSAETARVAFGNAFMALGQQIGTYGTQLDSLETKLNDLNQSLADSQDDLTEAQEEYAAAVLSGDTKAIANAKKQLDQRKKIVDSYEEQIKVQQEEINSLKSGETAWKAMGKVALEAIASILEGLGAQLAGMAITLFPNFGLMALAAAGSIAAYIAAGTIRGYAGSYADGGIVPGSSYSGDRLVANVNSGELILNAAQQDRIASQLAMFSRLTDLLSSMQFSSNGGINIDLRGSTFNDMSEEAVGKAIYHNVRSLQAEGVLPRW